MLPRPLCCVEQQRAGTQSGPYCSHSPGRGGGWGVPVSSGAVRRDGDWEGNGGVAMVQGVVSGKWNHVDPHARR